MLALRVSASECDLENVTGFWKALLTASFFRLPWPVIAPDNRHLADTREMCGKPTQLQ